MIEMAESKKKDAVDETPSGKALAEVGELTPAKPGKEHEPDYQEHGEKYQAAKRKHRWG